MKFRMYAFLLLVLCFCQPLFPQCDPVATKTFSTAFHADPSDQRLDYAVAAVQNAAGNYAVLGFRQNTIGSTDEYLLTFSELDPAGNLLTSPTVLNLDQSGLALHASDDFSNAKIIETTDAMGVSDGYAITAPILRAGGLRDAMLAKLSPSGCVVWAITFSELAGLDNVPIGLFQETGGELLLFVQTNTSANTGYTTLLIVAPDGSNCTHYDYQNVEINNQHTLIPTAVARFVTGAPDNARFVVAGRVFGNSTGVFYLDNLYQPIFNTFSFYNLDGGSGTAEPIHSVSQDGDYAVLCGGSGSEALLAKLEPFCTCGFGALGWSKKYNVHGMASPLSPQAFATSLEVLSSSDYVATGYASAFNLAGVSKGFLFKTTDLGIPQWLRHYGDAPTLFFDQISTPDGGFLMLGGNYTGSDFTRSEQLAVKTDGLGKLANCDCYANRIDTVITLPGEQLENAPMERLQLGCMPVDVNNICSGLPPTQAFCDQFCPADSLCEAAFSVAIGDCGAVTFTDLSTVSGTPTWSWTFSGGTSSTSTSQNPVVTYPASGSYTACQTVDNGVQQCSFCNTFSLVYDDEPPLCSLPAPLVLGTEAGVCFNNTNVALSIPPDNCDDHPDLACMRSDGLTMTAPFPKGLTTINCTATDASGNASTCSTTVTVNDTEPAMAVCQSSLLLNLDAACNANLSPSDVDGGSTDNCLIVSMALSQSTFSTCGDFPVTLTVTDCGGNVSSCFSVVTVQDVFTLTCPADITVTGTLDANGICTATVTVPTPTVTDNCGAVTLTSDAVNPFPEGMTTVTWTATDGCGNVANCQMVATVEPCTCTAPVDGLLRYYPFSGIGDFADHSGYGNDGLPINTPFFTSDEDSNPNSALLLTGNNYVAAPINVGTDNMLEELTLSAKFRLDLEPSSLYSAIVVSRDHMVIPEADDMAGLFVYKDGTDLKLWGHFDGSLTDGVIPDDPSIFGGMVVLGQWHCATMIIRKDGPNYVELYLDGVSVAVFDDQPVGVIDFTDGGGFAQFNIGANSDPLVNERFEGAIDEVKFYNRIVAIDSVCCEPPPPLCSCGPYDLDFTQNGITYPVTCGIPPAPNTCTPSDVMLVGNFTCVGDPAACLASDVDWKLYGPLGMIASGVEPANAFSVSIPAGQVSDVGQYFFRLDYYCPGAPDSCICIVRWEQLECDTCKVESFHITTGFDYAADVLYPATSVLDNYWIEAAGNDFFTRPNVFGHLPVPGSNWISTATCEGYEDYDLQFKFCLSDSFNCEELFFNLDIKAKYIAEIRINGQPIFPALLFSVTGFLSSQNWSWTPTAADCPIFNPGTNVLTVHLINNTCKTLAGFTPTGASLSINGTISTTGTVPIVCQENCCDPIPDTCTCEELDLLALDFMLNKIVKDAPICNRWAKGKNLHECDQVQWELNGTVVATSTGSDWVNIIFNSGANTLCMIVTRTTPSGIVCEERTVCKSWNFLCTPFISCASDVIANSGFKEGQRGYIGEDGSADPWQKAFGFPFLLDEPGAADENQVILSGNNEESDGLQQQFDCDAGQTYALSFYETPFFPLPQNTETRIIVRLSDQPQTSINCMGNCQDFALASAWSPQNGCDSLAWRTVSWQALESCADSSYLLFFVENDLPNDSFGLNRSYLALDNICLDKITGTKEATQKFNASLFPNPTTGEITLRFSVAMPNNGKVLILDLWGRTVQEAALPPGTQNHNFSISTLPTGFYFIQIMEEGMPVWVEKVVKQ